MDLTSQAQVGVPRIPYHLRCTERSVPVRAPSAPINQVLEAWEGGSFLRCLRRYSVGVELSALQAPQSRRILNAQRWHFCRVPQRRAGRFEVCGPLASCLLRYTAIHLRCILHLQCIAVYPSATRVQLNEGAPCAMLCTYVQVTFCSARV